MHITMLPRILRNCWLTNLATRTNHNKPFYNHMSSDSAAYDGDGKTTVRILNDEETRLNLINTYSDRGFRLSNNLFIHGSILVFPTYVYCWNVRRGIEITPESLFVFDLIVPKTKIIIIGYGQQGEPYDASIPVKLKQKGISCEMLPTPSAVTTYNYLVHDSVHVAGAFVPVKDEPAMTSKDRINFMREDVLNDFKLTPNKVFADAAEEIRTIKRKISEHEEKHSNRNKEKFDD